MIDLASRAASRVIHNLNIIIDCTFAVELLLLAVLSMSLQTRP